MKFREPEHGFGCINALNIVAMLAQCEAQPPAPTAQLKNVRWASAEEAQVKGGIAFAAGFKFSQQIMEHRAEAIFSIVRQDVFHQMRSTHQIQ